MQTETESPCTVSLNEALDQLDRVAPTAPFLALGQTVFWDEPMKGGVALRALQRGKNRAFVAGVHDTDYFAKLPSGGKSGGFKALPHNDTFTRGLWSAAAEFSALFGSETVVTREALLHAGLRLEKVQKNRPKVLDEATEAWGWRGIVSLDEDAPITADVKMRDLFPELSQTLDWAIETSLESISESQKIVSERMADQFRSMVAAPFEANPDITLADFYRELLPKTYNFAAGEAVPVETTKTSELLKFNRQTCVLPRFDLLNLFVCPDSSEAACGAYNSALKGSEIYGLERFGTGAIPFDLVIPGQGRGTIRIAPKAVVVMTHTPKFISLKQPLRHVQDLADVICSKFGDDCVLIGKAVSLIGMLAREFIFVFHEGASGYVKYTRRFHDLLAESGNGLKMNPILRVRLQVWDALAECNSWIRLPEPMQRPFGTEELTAPSFAARWRDVTAEQEQLLQELGRLRSPVDLINLLEARAGGSWHCLSREYSSLHESLERLEEEINDLKVQRRRCYGELRELKRQRVVAEREMGDHFRAFVFGKEPTPETLATRHALHRRVEELIHSATAKRKEIKDLLNHQKQVVSAPEIRAIHERRRTIELEAELKRLRLIRQAVITAKGLKRANFRPSAWWFPLLCPDSGWYRAAIDGAECYLESIAP